MADVVWGRLRRANARVRHDPGRWDRLFLHTVKVLRWAAAVAACGGMAWLAAAEARSSYLQSRYFTALTSAMRFTVAAGPSRSVRFPSDGPYDRRLGYAELPDFIGSLEAHGFAVDRQARWSAALARFVDRGFYAIAREKNRAGLEIFDGNGAALYRARHPRRAYRDFTSVPPLVADSLAFIEDQDLLDFRDRRHNPAVEWSRFTLAAAGRIAGFFDPHLREGGASTLATQLEKLRHSPGGVTDSVGEKYRQMVTAAARAYRDGPDTRAARQRLLVSYLDATPLASRPGYGEIIGLPEALWAWYGTDLAEADRVLTEPAGTPAAIARKGELYRQVLSLLLAVRRPGYYLMTHRDALARLTDRYLALLADAGVISPRLREAALAARLQLRTPPPPAAPPAADKTIERLRGHLMSLLGVPDLYTLDRLDVSARTSLDIAAQHRVEAVLSRLGDRDYDRSIGLVGDQLLGSGDPSRIEWSFVLYERGADRNFVRIDADTLNGPFDINSQAKLQLGSTAKLRTLVTYLDVIAELHERLASQPPPALRAVAADATADPLTRWAAGHLADHPGDGLRAMLEAAMQRRYSAAAATFLTGGGRQTFVNFARWEDHTRPTVEVAFHHSINLAFIRIMRDIVRYCIAQRGDPARALLQDHDEPARAAYLQRFAEHDGRIYLDRFYRDYHGRTPQQVLALLAGRAHGSPRALAVVFRSVHPEAGIAALRDFLAEHLPGAAIDDERLWDFYRGAAPRRLSLPDRGYMAGVNPLELWLVGYLREHPDASRQAVIKASVAAREQAYRWLFEGSRATQNLRIRTMLERDAFDDILHDWQRFGYPFDRLVPSLGTALGSSGDRPGALAQLMGIILDHGVRLPTVNLDHLRFAVGTPYETDLSVRPAPRPVMAPAVAATVREALLGVVGDGTASRLRGAYRAADGQPLAVGGKTGTGDNRFDHFNGAGALASQRVVDRTATFVFFLGDRFFGTVTAYVPGAIAAEYHFTSALAVQLLRVLRPQLQPLLDAAPAAPPRPIHLVAAPVRGARTPAKVAD